MTQVVTPTTSTWTYDFTVGRFPKIVSAVGSVSSSVITITRVDSNGNLQPIENDTINSTTAARQVNGYKGAFRATKTGSDNIGLDVD